MKLKRLGSDLHRIGLTDYYVIKNRYPDPHDPEGACQYLYDLAFSRDGKSFVLSTQTWARLRDLKAHVRRYGLTLIY